MSSPRYASPQIRPSEPLLGNMSSSSGPEAQPPVCRKNTNATRRGSTATATSWNRRQIAATCLLPDSLSASLALSKRSLARCFNSCLSIFYYIITPFVCVSPTKRREKITRPRIKGQRNGGEKPCLGNECIRLESSTGDGAHDKPKYWI